MTRGCARPVGCLKPRGYFKPACRRHGACIVYSMPVERLGEGGYRLGEVGAVEVEDGVDVVHDQHQRSGHKGERRRAHALDHAREEDARAGHQVGHQLKLHDPPAVFIAHQTEVIRAVDQPVGQLISQ
eukprot:1193467-Prorocentrum_minimum.AAC.4